MLFDSTYTRVVVQRITYILLLLILTETFEKSQEMSKVNIRRNKGEVLKQLQTPNILSSSEFLICLEPRLKTKL